jgi:hypothetical protein
MDVATFDRFLVLLDKHWDDPQRTSQIAAELNEWRESDVELPSSLRRITGSNLGFFCRNAIRRLSNSYPIFPIHYNQN